METARITFELSGLDCPSCAAKVERSVQRLDGVVDVRVDFLASTISLEYRPERITAHQVADAVAALGYRATPKDSVSGQAVFHIAAMDCADELRVIEAALRRTGAVRNVSANFVARTLSVQFDRDASDTEMLRQAIAAAGFDVHIEGRPAAASPGRSVSRNRWWLVGLSATCFVAALAAHVGELLHAWSLRPLASLGADRAVTVATLFFAVATAAGGWPIARSAMRALRLRTFDMNLLMSVAAVGAAFLWDWAEAASAMLLFSLALQLEGYTMGRARRAVEKLMRLAPTLARLRRDGHLVEVPAEQVEPGDMAVVRPGEVIPVDGVVTMGRTHVNQAPVTGESRPVPKEPGDKVFAGSINGDGAIEVRATKVHADTTLARMLHLVEEAQASRAPSQQMVERFARWYTPTVIAAAVVVAVLPPLAFGLSWRSWFFRALVMLVIACPCALVISTPVAIIAALASAARRGILIKGGLHVENLGRVRTFLFDKTGTLTRGQFAVDATVALDGTSADEVLRTAGAVEAHSDHVLAAAVRRHLREQGITTEEGSEIRALPGRGATAIVGGQPCYVGSGRLMEELGAGNGKVMDLLARLESGGRTAVLVARGRRVLGGIALTDRVRNEAAAAVRQLRALGAKDIVMLTGDNAATAEAVGRQVGVDHVHAGLASDEKVQKVLFLTRRDGATAMVGDGANDSPALAAATVGIAMGAAGSDVSIETADVALMTDRLDHVPEAVALGRRTVRIIRQNMTVALGLKAVFFALALADLATLWMAVVADMGASLLVIANGLRLLRPTRQDGA